MTAVGKIGGQRPCRVLVLGEDNRSCLAVVRSLGRQNMQVHVGWCPPGSAPRYSKYVAKAHDIPSYSPDDDGWKRVLVSILQREHFDLVIPCSDPTLIPLQQHRADFESDGQIYLLSDEVFEISFDKFRMNQLAKALGIRVPREARLWTLEQANELVAEFGIPVVLKPRASYTLDCLHRKSHVRKAYTLEELEKYASELLSQGPIQLQENFIGTGVGVEVLVWRGDVLLAFQHIRIHEPIRGGGSSYRKSVPLDPELVDATTKLVRTLNYTGVAMVEYKVNFKTGDWVFMEMNSRFWGSLPLAVAAGADFPYYLYQLLVEGKREFPPHYKKGIYCRNLLKDLSWMLQNFKADRSDPILSTVSLWQVAKEVINILTFRERNDTFVMDDPKVGFVELAYLIRTLRAMALNKIRLFLLSSPPIRKLYADKAMRALRKARTVLFVCKGNICRSPFAQYYAQSIFSKSARVVSCGFYPEKGRVCPQEAVDAAKEMRVDLTLHRSSVINEEIIQQADVIFTLDEENWRALITKYAFAKKKIHRLGLLAPQDSISIKDPYGGNINDFKVVYQSIIRALDSVMN